MRSYFSPIVLSLGLLVLAACQPQKEQEQVSEKAQANVTIVSNGAIYTSNPSQRTTEAFAFSGDEIIAVGALSDLEARFPNSAKIDLKGNTVIPGLIDAHVHLLSLGHALMRVDLVGSENKQDILNRLVEFEAGLGEGEWLLGRGWDQNDWPVKELPSAADLDQLFPTRPVWLTRIDGHAGWANSAAMKLSSDDLNGDWQPAGGEIVRDSSGQATGVFIDNAETLIAANVPPISDDQIRKALALATERTASVGLTSVHNAGTSKKQWDLIKSAYQQGQLNIRYYAMADGNNAMLDYLCQEGAQTSDDPMLTARAVKLYSDGALGSRGAALLAPYSDSENQTGLLIETPEVLAQYAKKAADCGLQVNIHAIGDRGNRVTLDALEAAQSPSNPGRHRIEHSQVVNEQDFKRFKQLSLIASVQPTHATSDMYWAEDRVGSERIKGAYAWQKFIAHGIPLALGSDFPVEKADPLLGFHAAVSRQDSSNWPEGGWYADQRLTRDQALHGFTLGAAYAAFQEDKVGSIEIGKKADFVIYSKDIMSIPEEEILSAQVKATYLNGNPIFQAE